MKNYFPMLRPLIVAASLLMPYFLVGQGIPPKAEAGSTAIVIRVGEEWIREYPARRIEVQLVTRPYFAVLSKALPILEIGGTGVTFVREGDGGAMVLFGKEKLLLPRVVEVDLAGRSLDPLAIKLRFDRGSGVSQLDVDGWTFTVSSNPFAHGAGLPVVIAAGAEVDWIVDSFKVIEDDGTSHDWNAFTRSQGVPNDAVSTPPTSPTDLALLNDRVPGSAGFVRLGPSDPLMC